MKVTILSIGRPAALFAEAIAEYERRVARYWRFEVIEIREERGGGRRSVSEIQAAESARLLERVPRGAEALALTRTGSRWSSRNLAEYLDGLAVSAHPGAAFLVGGALGLSTELIRSAQRTISLSPLTLPHELARLILTEQIYRAGTIVRGESYHRGR